MPPAADPHDDLGYEKFVLETDQAPEFWQFLNTLWGSDLLVELIVNELDANSPHTIISFEQQRLICEGSGDPIDEEGWARLRKIKGAGDTVKAKRGLFGVKNHGLKACFTIGDDIRIRSAGLQLLQTLYAHGRGKPASPGVGVPPKIDFGAPSTGTRIEVSIRRKAIDVQTGEYFHFGAVTDDELEAMFADAAAMLPKRLLGIIRPGMIEQYRLTLSHHRLGSRSFEFRCGRVKRERDRISFHRECHELMPDLSKDVLEREQAILTVSGLKPTRSTARFFLSENYRVKGKRLFQQAGVVTEVAWGVDASGRLRDEVGRLRYPVAYASNSPSSLSGHGAHYSGPFVSDTARHEIAALSNEWNGSIIDACDHGLAKALTGTLIPRHRTRALELIAQFDDAKRLKRLIEQLSSARAFPAVNLNGKNATVKRGERLVVPSYGDQPAIWSKQLAKIAPPGSKLADSKTPQSVLALLGDTGCEGWLTSHIRFDEVDVMERMQKPDAQFFPWRNQAERRDHLTDPGRARAHLDALLVDLQQSADRPDNSQLELPDADCNLRPIPALKRGASLPKEVIGLPIPPVIHPALRDHHIFRLKEWRLPSYAFRDMLRDGGLSGSAAAVRKRFVNWLVANSDEVPKNDWPALKSMPIWPATDGSLQVFEQLCWPDAKLGAALGAHLLKPSGGLRKFCAKLGRRGARLRLRTEPTAEEITGFYEAAMAPFPLDRPLTKAERRDFHALERSLASVCQSERARRALKALSGSALGLSKAATLRPLFQLIRENGEIKRLGFQPIDLLDRPQLELDATLPPALKPSANAAFEALRASPEQGNKLLPRLRVITSAWDLTIDMQLRSLPCIPVDGKLRAPEELAFKGNQGDFWGDWKIIIGAAGLADDAQALYRAAGVIKSLPTPETSHAFFKWLATKSSKAVTKHLDRVMRHIAHKQAVAGWLLEPPGTPCIPVENQGQVQLLSIGDAQRFAVVDDFPELAAAIRSAEPNPKLRLAILSVKEASHPIADQLEAWGIPSLSSIASGPINPSGHDQAEAPKRLLLMLRGLSVPTAARRFRRQLQEFDIKQTQLVPHFQKKLNSIKRITLVRNLTIQFKARGRSYRTSRAWAVFPDEIWLDRDGELEDLLIKAITDLIFEEPRPRFLRAVLKEAMTHQSFHDFQRASANADTDEDDHQDEDQDEFGDEGDGDGGDNDDGPTESSKPHPGQGPDPSRNNPKPGELSTGGGGAPKKRGKGGAPQREEVPLESTQRRELKAGHYAFHCQHELASRSPSQLAAPGSYAEFAENRQKIMEGHHPDKVTAGGPRHAGNLLILSHTSHEKLGTRLSRAEITEALEKAWTPDSIKAADGSIWLEGGIAATCDAVTGEALPLFFTEQHRKYWLGMARGVALDEGSSDLE